MSTAHIFEQYQAMLKNWEYLVKDKRNLTACLEEKDAHSKVCINNFNDSMLLMRIYSLGNENIYSQLNEFSNNLGLYIIMEGHDSFEFSKQHNIQTHKGDIMLIQGEFEYIRKITTPENNRASMMHLELSRHRIDEWNDELKSAMPQNGALQKILCPNKSLLNKAKLLLLQSQEPNYIETLKLESLSLDILSHLFELNKITPKQKTKIDDAVDIIRNEFHHSLSISSLSRRVGLNECYLKRDFKAQLGFSIGDYIRQLRLNTALELLLNENKSIKEVMYFVGYSHIGYFNKIFKQKFGYFPNDIIK
ncbi:helix-turn-helix domain-containing protein [Ursidibacter arcticus]